MDFSLSRRRRKAVKAHTDIEYPCRLQLYSTPPQGNISLAEFESHALDRLAVLRGIYNGGVKYKKGSEQYNKALTVDMKKYLNLRVDVREEIEANVIAKYEERRKDHISHFLLRLAYCRSEDARRWFCDQEKELFRMRLEEHTEDLPNFLVQHDLKFEEVSEREMEEKEAMIRSSNFIKGKLRAVYKVPWIEALELVKGRRVYLERGMAYVPQVELVSILTGLFRSRLSKALLMTARALPSVSDDERIMPLLNSLTTAYVGEDYSNTKFEGQVSLDQLGKLSKVSFAPCMRTLYDTFTDQHHLKHGGRLQFCLFLKGLGLTMEDVRLYFRSEFSKKMDIETYNKSGHDYMVRHLFGKEGKRSEKAPYSCMKIITSNVPSAGDAHGCPFRHSDSENLERKLTAWKIPKVQIKEIVQLVEGQHYQLACTKYYEITHKLKDAGFGINHPNQYFLESQLILGNTVNVGKQGYQGRTSQPQLPPSQMNGSQGSSQAGTQPTQPIKQELTTAEQQELTDLQNVDMGDEECNLDDF